ncbi:MAG: sensor histidine kinase [Curvibacter sp.]|nr:sensor histidine kinase [Curvibacter sp.]
MRLPSLRSTLMLWLLLPLTTYVVVDAAVNYHEARHTAQLVQQRMLLGAARMIGQQVQYEDGVVQVVIPPAALELFASPSHDRVYYRVARADGELLSGHANLASPPRFPAAEEAVYFDAGLNGQAVRAVAFGQPLLSEPGHRPVLIEVAQTLAGRDALAREIWLGTVQRQLLLLGLGAVLLWFGLRLGLRPVLTLREQVLRRRPGTLDPLQAAEAPTELAPLVAAINDYVGRLDHHMSAHSRFIADAAHQLRTPLTVLNTQVVYAIRHPAPEGRDEALQATLATVQHGMRLVNQLLSFSLAEAIRGQAPRQEPVDLGATVQQVLETLASLAGQRQIDLGFEGLAEGCEVQGSPRLLHELVANLIDNALRYTPPGGVVTARLLREPQKVLLQIDDNGPGIPASERERVFERFHRLNNQQSDGCGLGLAIVREIAESCGAVVELGEPPQGRGLRVTVHFTLRPQGEAAGTASAKALV